MNKKEVYAVVESVGIDVVDQIFDGFDDSYKENVRLLVKRTFDAFIESFENDKFDDTDMERNVALLSLLVVHSVKRIHDALGAIVGVQLPDAKGNVSMIRYIKNIPDPNLMIKDNPESGSLLGTQGSGGFSLTLAYLREKVEGIERELGFSLQEVFESNEDDAMFLVYLMSWTIANDVVNKVIGSIIEKAPSTSYKADIVDRESINKMAFELFKVSTDIGRKTRRSVGNFIIANPVDIVLMQHMKHCKFEMYPDPFKNGAETFICKVGKFNNQFEVYSMINPILENKILIGYKSERTDVDAGLHYTIDSFSDILGDNLKIKDQIISNDSELGYSGYDYYRVIDITQ